MKHNGVTVFELEHAWVYQDNDGWYIKWKVTGKIQYGGRTQFEVSETYTKIANEVKNG